MQLKHIGLFALLFCSFAFTESNQFSISGVPDPNTNPEVKATLDDPATQNTLIARLKQQAVAQWLQKYLGDRYSQFETLITPDFGEKYILEYKVNRIGQNREGLELKGQLDIDSLRSWVRVADSKKGNVSNKAVFLISATAPGLEGVRGSAFAEAIAANLAGHLQRMGVKLAFLEGNYPLETPPVNDNQINTLKMGIRDTSNLAVWTHIKSCQTCNGGLRIDHFLYSLESNRVLAVDSEELQLTNMDLVNAEKAKSLAPSLLTQFKSSVDSAISESKAALKTVQIRIEGIENYRLLKLIDQQYSRSDFASQLLLKRSERQLAEFEVLTHLSTEDLAQRIQSMPVASLNAKVQRIDPKTLVVRYSK